MKKQQLSIWMLYAGSTAPRLLGLLVLLSLGNVGLFFRAWGERDAVYPQLDRIFEGSYISVAFFVVFLLWTAVLLLPSQAKAAYTLNRLGTSPLEQLVIHVLYCAMTYLILWAAQVGLLLALLQGFGSRMPEDLFGPQSLLLIFYRNDFLHSLLPVADWTRYIRNLLLVAAMSCTVAGTSLGLRRGGGYLIALFLMAGGVWFFFPAGLAALGNDAGFAMAALFCGWVTINSAWESRKEGAA